MNKKTVTKDNRKELSNLLDRVNNFVDYFTVIGLPTDLIFSDFLYENDVKTINESNLFKPKILSNFPPFDKSTISIDENIIKHCFPNGYFLKEFNSKPPEKESFGFVLDNNYYSITYPQKFISCLIFYESLESYSKAYRKFKNFHEDMKNMYILDQNKTIIRKSEKFLASRMSYNTVNIRGSKSIEDDAKTENRFIDEDMTSVKSLRINFSNSSSNKSKLKNLYVQKCICLTSLYPFFIDFGKILNTLYNFAKNGKVIKPLEKIIESLIIEVPAPPRGIWKVQFEVSNAKFDIMQPQMNKLPLLNVNLITIFNVFYVEQILEIYKHLILETRIIFFSEDIVKLTPIIEGFLSFIYPLKYVFQHVTILPQENFMILESVTPYIVGINMKYSDDFFDKYEIDNKDITSLIVDIGNDKNGKNGKVVLKYPNNNMMSKQQYLSEEFPDLPKHYLSKLHDNIINYFILMKKETNGNQKKESNENFNQRIRDFFFQFIVNIFQDYSKYINKNYYTNNDIGTPTIQNLFRVDDFLNSVAHIDRLFYKKVLDTQMFVELIYKRMIPKDAKDRIEILFFDEHIIEKNNRKMFSKKAETPFLNSNIYDHYKNYPVLKSTMEIDYSYFRKLENMKEALKFGQEIHWDNDMVSISYNFFPILMNHVFFNPQIKNYFIPEILSEIVDEKNSEIAKAYLGNIVMHYNEMDNCIYLVWIQLWSMVFWYHDKEEKKFRFQQLLIILDKVMNHEMETFTLLFDAVTKYGEDYMVLKLYEKLINSRLNPNYLMCVTVMRIIERNQSNNKKDNSNKDTKNNQNILECIKQNEDKSFNVTEFRKRTFRTQNETRILGDDVIYYMTYECQCNEKIDINKLSRSFYEMRKEIDWAICPNKNCNSTFLPKIQVRLGTEMNKHKLLKFDTSLDYNVILYSPSELKKNYNVGLIQLYQSKLDIDNFRINFKDYFWSSLWYFRIKDLDYSFFLPYEYNLNLEDYNKINYPIKSGNPEEQMKTDIIINTKNSIHKSKRNDLNSVNNKSFLISRDTCCTVSFNHLDTISKEMLTEHRKTNVDSVNSNHAENFNYLNTCMIQETKSYQIQMDSIELQQTNPQLKTIYEENEYSANNKQPIDFEKEVNEIINDPNKNIISSEKKHNINEENKEFENEEILTTLHVNEDKFNQIMEKLENIDD